MHPWAYTQQGTPLQRVHSKVLTAGCSEPFRVLKTLQCVHSRSLPFSVYTAGCSKSLQLTAGCSKLFRALKHSSVCTQQGAQLLSAHSRVLRTLQGTEKLPSNISACTEQGTTLQRVYTARCSKSLQHKTGYILKTFSMYTCTVTKSSSAQSCIGAHIPFNTQQGTQNHSAHNTVLKNPSAHSMALKNPSSLSRAL